MGVAEFVDVDARAAGGHPAAGAGMVEVDVGDEDVLHIARLVAVLGECGGEAGGGAARAGLDHDRAGLIHEQVGGDGPGRTEVIQVEGVDRGHNGRS